MYDRWEYTIPAETAKEDAIRVKCPITKGFLKRIVISFPPGCQLLARCTVAVGERPIAPRSAGNYIAADGMAVNIDHLNEPVQDDLPVLNWTVWNIDETYDHTIWMGAEWLSEDKPYEMIMARSMEELSLLLRNLIGV